MESYKVKVQKGSLISNICWSKESTRDQPAELGITRQTFERDDLRVKVDEDLNELSRSLQLDITESQRKRSI